MPHRPAPPCPTSRPLTARPARHGRLGATLLIGTALAANAHAAEPPATVTAVTLEPVVVSARTPQREAFDTPAAVSVVTRADIEAAGPQVNLSESLVRVPGLSVLNRQNYAQDLQLSIRGFGARSTFGIRGVRLVVDGIPATMPDGQGQASTISLASAGRIEVLRGPLAQLYGNAAGGVVQVFTEDDAPVPTVSGSVAGGAYGQVKTGLKYSTTTPDYGLTLEGSQFRSEGYRDHSEVQRGQLNGRLRTRIGTGTQVALVLNALEQPETQDPLGLTRAQWEADPKQAASAAFTQNTGKTVRQQQLGVVVEHAVDDATTLVTRLYGGQRSLGNTLSTPLATQQQPQSSGGIVRFARHYEGAATQWQHRTPLDAERSVQWTAGATFDRMTEDRQGYLNLGGETGDLKRDERNVVRNQDLFAQAAVDLSRDWTVTAGARHSRVRFTTADRFVTATNGDDSGAVDYRATNPVLGATWRLSPTLNVYANAGRGFETPTFTEIAYRPGASGLNTALGASHSRHLEAGLKWRPAEGQQLELAVFDVRTRGELIVDTNDGGRSTYRNAGRTGRRGIELSHTAPWTDSLRSTVALTALRARFVDGFTDSKGDAVAAQNRLPGTPERNLFADLAWAPRGAWGGFQTAVELVHRGRLFVNDTNTDAAPAVTLLNLRAGLRQQSGPWTFTQLLRIDNATDRRYAGSVIVNDTASRYFEPALPRTLMLAADARYTF